MLLPSKNDDNDEKTEIFAPYKQIDWSYFITHELSDLQNLIKLLFFNLVQKKSRYRVSVEKHPQPILKCFDTHGLSTEKAIFKVTSRPIEGLTAGLDCAAVDADYTSQLLVMFALS